MPGMLYNGPTGRRSGGSWPAGHSVRRKVKVMGRERRRLFQEEESPAEPGRFGCPMLSREHRSLLTDVGRPLMRCQLGWALHDDVEIARCNATEAVIDCWKVHPERMPLVELVPAGATGEGTIEQKAAAD